MMIDASAIVAILNREPDGPAFEQILDDEFGNVLTTATALFEAAVGLARSRSAKENRPSTAAEILHMQKVVEAFVEANAIRVDAITEDHWRAAMAAAARYGRCVGHPAGLNFGDCFAYAAARVGRTRLIYKGGDFALTDLAAPPV